MTAKHKAAIRRGIKAAAKKRMHWTKTPKGRTHHGSDTASGQ